MADFDVRVRTFARLRVHVRCEELPHGVQDGANETTPHLNDDLTIIHYFQSFCQEKKCKKI